MDIHPGIKLPTVRPSHRTTVIRYGLCTALCAALLIGGAILSTERPPADQQHQRKRITEATDGRQRPSTDGAGGRGESFGLGAGVGRASGVSGDLCKDRASGLQTAQPDRSWVDRQVTEAGVDLRLSHPADWTTRDIGGVVEVTPPAGDLAVLVTTVPGEVPVDVASAAAMMMPYLLADLEVRSSSRVELSGAPGCHLVIDHGGSLLHDQAEMWLALPEGGTMVMILAVSFGEATASDWAVARGVAATLAVENWT